MNGAVAARVVAGNGSVTTGFIICGALAREVLDIIAKYGWDAEVIGVSALHHLHPERIAPNVEKRILELRGRYKRLIVVYGDCGTYGALDAVLEKYGIQRIAGPHCYEMYAGKRFAQLAAEETGTYFLTDFLVRKFRGTILKGMGLDRFPELKGDYFGNYTRLVYLSQSDDLALQKKAQEIADYLGLPLTIQPTGYGLLEERLVELMNT